MIEKKLKKKTIKVTQIRSTIGKNKLQKKQLLSLGLKKIGSTRVVNESNAVLGLIKKVSHLIKVE
tara:strand:- start:683 stop:877 length:195 start_codon:yes stop_codon:yes gene_type:complete